MFSTLPKQISTIELHLLCRLQRLSISTSQKYCHLVTSLPLPLKINLKIEFNNSARKVPPKQCGKRDNAHKKHFLLLQPCLLTFYLKNPVILSTCNMSSANTFNLDNSKIKFVLCRVNSFNTK